jgi:hypothetical protein
MVLVGFVIGAAYELEGEKLSEHRWLMPWIAGAFVGLASYLNNKISKPTRGIYLMNLTTIGTSRVIVKLWKIDSTYSNG